MKKLLLSLMIFLVACGSPDLTNDASTDTTVQDVATCGMVSVSSGVKVICNGTEIGTLTNGKDGEGCSLTPLDSNLGYSVVCGEQSGLILNGIDGTDGVNGTDGTSCSVTAIPDGSGVYVICGESAVALYNGKDGVNGIDGASCTALESTGGFDLYCDGELIGSIKNGADGVNGTDGVNGIDGINGVDGTSCYATPYDENGRTGYNLYCADTLVGVIYDGVSGTDTLVLKDTVVIRDSLLLRDSTYEVVYDTLVISQKDTVVLSAQDTLVLSHKDTVVVSNKDTLVVIDTLVKVDTMVVSQKDTVVINEAIGCSIVSTTGSTIKIACGEDTTDVQANITVNNTYNNGSLESTTFDPIIVYVSSSSVESSSSSVEVVVNSSSSLNYNLDLNVTASYVGPTQSKTNTGTYSLTIYRGDSTMWKIRTTDTSSVTDILSSTYEWKFPGAKNIEYYAGVGDDGLLTPYVVYDSIGTFRASYSINGSTYKTSNYSVTVKASLIRNCACREDTTFENADTTKWVLSGCTSYAPITKYEWDGCDRATETAAYTPKSYTGQTKVTVTNSDETKVDIACGNVIEYYYDESKSKYYTSSFTLGEGTHYITYNCNNLNYDDDVSFDVIDGGKGKWISSKSSRDITTSHYITEDWFTPAGSEFAVIVESGSIRVRCYSCINGCN